MKFFTRLVLLMIGAIFLSQPVFSQSNECNTATVLTSSVTCSPTAGTNVGATQSIPAITCGIFTSSSALDVWYQFTATAAAHTITVVGAGTFDAIIDVRSGACNGTNIGCADATTTGGTETVTVGGLTLGSIYFIRIYGWAGGTGTFTTCVTGAPPAPANDECASATTLTSSTTCSPTAGTSVNATQSIAPITCGIFTSSSSLDVWYQFTAVSTTHTITVVGGSGFDAIIDVRSGACNGSNIACADATTTAGTEVATVSGLTVGQTYRARIYGWAGGTGTFTICVTHAGLGNDQCSGATVLTPGAPGAPCSPVSGTTVSGTQTIPAITCATFTGTADDDVWYQFTATATSHNVTVAGGSGFDAVVDVRSGGCNGTNIGCADATTSAGTETVTLSGLTIGSTYLVRVYSFGSLASNQGTFTICVTTPNTAPANNDCASATTLTPGASCSPTAGTTVGATQSLAAITCATFTGTADDDVWYQFIATSSSHNVTVMGGAGFDAVVDVRSGACNGVNIGCADATQSAGTETVTLSGLTVGATYLVRVYSFSALASNQGTFNICVTTPAPANNDCAGATTLTPGASCSPTAGTTIGATQSLAAITCATFTGTADDDVWYQFTATSTSHNVTVMSGGGFDAVVDVRSGGCNGTNIGCADATVSGGTETATVTGLTVGTTYLVRVYSFGSLAANQGTFNICVTTPAPDNNDCAGATILTPGVGCSPVSGTTLGATQSLAAITCGTFTGTADDDVWYQFTATSASHNVNVTGNPGFDAVVDVRSGGCNGTNIGCADATTGGGSETAVLTGLTPGTTYLVRVYSFGSSVGNQGTFNICVTTPTVANDDCVSAVSLTSTNICSPTSGTTINATQTLPPGVCGGFAAAQAFDVWYQFVATSPNHVVTVDGASNMDAVVEVRSGGCNGTYITCSDGTTADGTETINLTGLTVGNTYLVRVQDFFSSGGDFTICVTTLPPSCVASPTSPTNGQANMCPSATTTLTWATAPGATSYDVYFGTTNPPPFVANTASTSYAASTPTATTYFWQVSPVGSGGANLGCSVWSFSKVNGSFTLPANGASTVACPALIVQPVPPAATTNCGTTVTPTGPSISNAPDPLTCEGTRTFTWTYNNGFGQISNWSHVTTVERNTFTVPANGASTVACPALAVQPTPPTVMSNCGETLTPAAPTITNVPNPISCEGTRTYAFLYTDCEGNTATWSHVYTIERNPFTVPANGAVTVNCPANATQPVPPTVMSNCGETLTPTGPTVTSVPASITCEGTRTYAWVYTDCEGNTATWSFVYTVERIPFLISTPPGSATVSCPAGADVIPTPPTVTSNCGEPITPVRTASPANACEGDRVYTFTYTDCEGNSAAWLFTYHVVYQDFVVPTSIVGTVNCPSEVFQPTPPSVLDNCGNAITPVGPTVSTADNANGCETSRSYSWTYTDCSGNTHGWSQTFLVDYDGDFIAPLDEENYVACLAYAVAPFPQVLFDGCGQQMVVSAPVIEESISPTGCSGVRRFTFAYSDCAGNSHPWSFTYYINDDQGPLGTCPVQFEPGGSGGTVTVDVPDLACIEDVPCPDDYDFTSKVEELLAAGGYFDVCDGITVNAALDSWTDLWQCEDPDDDGVHTFGRTFYFRIADHCGNEYPSLCSVTYSGLCQPLATFPQTAWGIAGGTPGTSVGLTDLQLIGSLLSPANPVVVGGSGRSLTVNDAQCVVDLLPGGSAPGPLANCHQTNCTGCNPMGIGGMKNPLAANAVALTLNMRYNVLQNELTMAAVRSQGLGCMGTSPNITACSSATAGGCRLRVFEQSGAEHQFPHTLGGLLDLANLFLNGGLQLSIGQQQQYASAINQALTDANARWNEGRVDVECPDGSGVAPDGNDAAAKALPTTSNTINGLMTLAPNPASNSVTLTLALDAPAQVRLDVRNQLGQLVMGRDLGTADRLSEQIDLTQLANGLYFVQVIAGQQRLEQKLVVSRD